VSAVPTTTIYGSHAVGTPRFAHPTLAWFVLFSVAIDQYAEAALGNREFFLNKPHSIGGGRKSGDVP